MGQMKNSSSHTLARIIYNAVEWRAKEWTFIVLATNYRLLGAGADLGLPCFLELEIVPSYYKC